MKIHGGVAVVTGGASGIGLELAKQLLSKGCSVSICDLSLERLNEASEVLNVLVGRLQSEGVVVDFSTSCVDVTNREEVNRFSLEVIEKHKRVSLLFNNAGVVAANTLENSSWEEIDLVLNVNINGVINCTKIFMPYMVKEKEAYIVNTSSLEGIIAIPGDLTYCTSKYAVRGFSEALMVDNMITRPNVRVMCVHPGMVRTNMLMNNASRINPNALMLEGYEKYTEGIDVKTLSDGFKKIGSTSPEAAARQILSGVYWNQSRVLVGNDAVIFDFLFRMFPRALYNKFLYFPTLAIVLFLVKYIGKRMLAIFSILWLAKYFKRR